MADWEAVALLHARTHAYDTSQPDDCCGNCVSMKEQGAAYVEDFCKDVTSPWPNEHVERHWWCVQHERRRSAPALPDH